MARLSNSRRGVTLVLSAALLAAFCTAPVVAIADEAAHLARAHAHGRMVRKRAPLFGFPNGDTSTSTTTTEEASTPAVSPTVSATSTSTSSGDFWDTLTSLIANPFPTPTTTSTSTTESTSSTISTSSFSLNATTTSSSAANTTTTSTTISTTSTQTAATTPTTAPIVRGSTSTVIVAASGSSSAVQESQSSTPQAAAVTHGVAVARKTIVVLVAIAGSIGLAFLIWTGIRKWKFRPSRSFEDRMQDPINWQPNNIGYDAADPASRIEAHRRNGSTGSHGSFGSSEMAHNTPAQPMQYSGYGATGVGATGMTRSLSGHSSHANYQPSQVAPPLPPHDFTAGANGSDSYDYYHNQGQHMNGTAASPPQMVENGLTRGGGQARPISMRSDNPYDGLDDDYDQRPGLPPHHGGAYNHTGF